MSEPVVAVVVPTRNRSARLHRLVEALEAQSLSMQDFEVVLVDDASTDDTSAVLESLARDALVRVRVLSQTTRTGPAGARNAGWRATTAEVVAFTDDDCIPSPDWLQAGVDALRLDRHLGIVQGRTVPETLDGLDGFVATRHINSETAFFEACNLFVRRGALEQSGGFDEVLGLHFEDTALGWAVVEAGWARGFAPDALVHHDVTHPGVGWHIRKALLDGHAVKVARDHPSFRRALWRPWCIEPRRAAFAAAVLGSVVGLRWRPALLAALPYAFDRRPRSVSRAGAEQLAGWLALDAATLMAMARGWWRWRRFLL